MAWNRSKTRKVFCLRPEGKSLLWTTLRHVFMLLVPRHCKISKSSFAFQLFPPFFQSDRKLPKNMTKNDDWRAEAREKQNESNFCRGIFLNCSNRLWAAFLRAKKKRKTCQNSLRWPRAWNGRLTL